MKKFFLVITLLVSAAFAVSAQDIITKLDGTNIKAKVYEVGATDIKYKNFSNLDGPTYTISKKEVLMVTYENGERDVFGSQATSTNAIPEGIMTLDRWSGRLSINGMSIDKKSTYLYLTPEAEALYKSGDSISSVGNILMGVGVGGAAGYLIGSLASGSGAVYGVCGVLVAIGLPLHVVGLNKINSAIADYNSKHGFAQRVPELSIGAQQYGFGLALNF